MEELTNYATPGLGAIALALLILREVFAFVKEKKNGNASLQKYSELDRWRSMEEAIRKLTSALNNNSQLIQTVIHTTKETREEVKEAVRSCKNK